jgi:hypothetical protein
MPSSLKEKLTLRSLGRLAGAKSFFRGEQYFQSGCVLELRSSSYRVDAIVQGRHIYNVSIIAGTCVLDYNCDCPHGEEGEFCKHCVAAGLAWLETATKTIPPTAKPQVKTNSVAAAKAAFDEAIHFRGTLNEFQAQNFAERVHRALDLFSTLLLKGKSAEVRSLCGHALLGLDRVHQNIDDPEGLIPDLASGIEDLYSESCRIKPPGPLTLAQELFHLESSLSLEAFVNSPEKYRELLQAPGLTEFARLILEAAKVKSRGWRELPLPRMEESLARARGDINEEIRLRLSRASFSGDYLELAGRCLELGRQEQALEIAYTGLRRGYGYGDSNLMHLITSLHVERGEPEAALNSVLLHFSKSPSVAYYEMLESLAAKTARWPDWSERALASVDPKGQHNRVLVDIQLRRGDIAAAWNQALASQCDDGTWVFLARQRAATHPEEAATVLIRCAASDLGRNCNGDYKYPVSLLIEASAILAKIGLQDEFLRALNALRASFKSRRNFLKLLDKNARDFSI